MLEKEEINEKEKKKYDKNNRKKKVTIDENACNILSTNSLFYS